MKLYNNIPVPDDFDLTESTMAFDAWLAGQERLDSEHFQLPPILVEYLSQTWLAATRGWSECSPYRAHMMLLTIASQVLSLDPIGKGVLARLEALARTMNVAVESRHSNVMEGS